MPSAAGRPNPAGAEVGSTPAAAIVLAAGSGSRYEADRPKLLAELRGKPLIRWAIDAVVQSGLPRPYVVTGAVDLSGWLDDVTEVRNPNWGDGLASSLIVGIKAAREGGHDAVVVALGDQPGISPSAWRAVADTRGAPVAVATYAGVRGHPVRLAEEVWDDLPRTGEDGARLIMRSRPELVTEVPCSGNPMDVDTAEDLDRFSSRTHSA